MNDRKKEIRANTLALFSIYLYLDIYKKGILFLKDLGWIILYKKMIHEISGKKKNKLSYRCFSLQQNKFDRWTDFNEVGSFYLKQDSRRGEFLR